MQYGLYENVYKMRNLKTLTKGVTCLYTTGFTQVKTSIPQSLLDVTSLNRNSRWLRSGFLHRGEGQLTSKHCFYFDLITIIWNIDIFFICVDKIGIYFLDSFSNYEGLKEWLIHHCILIILVWFAFAVLYFIYKLLENWIGANLSLLRLCLGKVFLSKDFSRREHKESTILLVGEYSVCYSTNRMPDRCRLRGVVCLITFRCLSVVKKPTPCLVGVCENEN